MKRQVKIARGYRLYPKTHKKILKIQGLLKSDSEEAIAAACKLYLKTHAEMKGQIKPLTKN